MLLNYFKLQMRLNSRKLKEAGVSPLIGYLTILSAFVACSFFLFYKTEYAGYLYLFFALSLISPLSERRRNDFLRTCFSDKSYRQIRILENLAVVIPFVAFLLFKLQFAWAALLIGLAILWVFNTFNTQLHFTIPTPFAHRPYEFAVGFRLTYYLLVIAYLLAIIAVSVSNFNLGIFALLLVFLITLGFYQQPEPEYFVWSHSLTPVQFLLYKLRVAITYATLLALPVAILLSAFFLNQVHIALGFMLLGNVYLCCMVTARYSAYPTEITLPHGILLAICLVMPPAVVIILPYFINSSIKRLKPILK